MSKIRTHTDSRLVRAIPLMSLFLTFGTSHCVSQFFRVERSSHYLRGNKLIASQALCGIPLSRSSYLLANDHASIRGGECYLQAISL